MEALERERADAERATAKREEALERKRADLRRVEEAVRASVERRREEERKYYNAMRARTEARTEEEIAVAEKELKAEEARVRATNEAREASFAGTRGGGHAGHGRRRAGRTDGRFVRARNRTRDVGDRPGALFAGGTPRATGLGAPGTNTPRCYDPRRRRSPDAVVSNGQ